MCEEGATTPLIWTPLSTLHPCTWSFFLLIDEADELSPSQDCRFWSFWVRYGSTRDQEEGGRWCTCCTMCLSTWMGARSPANRRQKGFALWDQRVGGAGWHESAHRLEKKKEKKISCWHAYPLDLLHYLYYPGFSLSPPPLLFSAACLTLWFDK